MEKKATGWLIGTYLCFFTALLIVLISIILSAAYSVGEAGFAQQEPFMEITDAEIMIVFFNITGFFIAILGIILGIAAFSSEIKTPDGEKNYKYIKSHRIAGLTGAIMLIPPTLFLIMQIASF